MSDTLREALAYLKERSEASADFPVAYLHDPETGKPFAAMVQVDAFRDFLDHVPESAWNPYSHDHVEHTDPEDEASASEERKPNPTEGVDMSAEKVKFKFTNGEKVRDTVTGFEGVVTAQFHYINGCKRYLLEAGADKPSAKPEELIFDEGRLELVNAPKKEVPRKPTGGARPAPTRQRH